MAGTVFDIIRQVVPPRAIFVDHPVGRTFGPPHDRQRNEAVLARVLAELPNFIEPGEIRDPGFKWTSDGSRAWENELRAEMLHDH
ncbi:MAG: hypothetical protein OEN50_01415 [Deltaproteobacteria bacterium]|nr:hypothetical protein [Deltaproteobacteria bacterium]